MSDDTIEASCKKCGIWLEWQECDACGGEGVCDLSEDDPINYSEGTFVLCGLCNGRGGWWYCPTCSENLETAR